MKIEFDIEKEDVLLFQSALEKLYERDLLDDPSDAKKAMRLYRCFDSVKNALDPEPEPPSFTP